MTSETDDNPLEQLIELFVYAPIGMLYEYPDVLPRLIKKGKSQVQLAKFFGQMAARQRGASAGETVGGAADVGAQTADAVAGLAARFVTELGSQLGLAPPSGATSTAASTTGIPAARPHDSTNTAGSESGPEPEASDLPAKTVRLPIAGYDDLTAKEIIGLLEDLTGDQLIRVRDHEAANRNRKTVLAKIDRLSP